MGLSREEALEVCNVLCTDVVYVNTHVYTCVYMYISMYICISVYGQMYVYIHI